MDDSGEVTTEELYDIIPNPQANAVDLSNLRGVAGQAEFVSGQGEFVSDLDNLAEIVPDVCKSPVDHQHRVSYDLTKKAHTAQNLHRSHQGDDEDSPSEVDAYSDTALEERKQQQLPNKNEMMSAQSISTATQTHEVLMPMYLPNFKPATGCTNASDFIVRCFVARLRAGITVVKHGRSRWAKSRLRILHIHNDGRSLSWKPAEGEPSSSKRPPKLDLSACTEVRHAWSPDPQNPMYTGTSILRLKCEAANAHKSFALIFPARTVDITAVTADQCKVLMEGFSALCFRLQVANLVKSKFARPMPEDDGVSTTPSATLTNSSTPRNRT